MNTPTREATPTQPKGKTMCNHRTDHDDEIVTLLTEIRDRLPKPEGAKGEPTDDLPGEPVEPGDLRAGDRVSFMWDGERITRTLVSNPAGHALRSDTPDRDDFYPNVVYQGEWCGRISDVRLIERAPREDEDPDEALAEAMYNMEHGDGEVCVWSNTSEFERDLYRDLARAAREHIEAEKSQMGAALYYGASARARAEEADPDTVTLPREVLEQAVRVWGEARGHAGTLDAYRTARAALGWGDSDDA